MSCRTTYCVGGGCEPTSTDPQGYVEAFGYTYEPDDPLGPQYSAIIADAPADVQNPVWRALAEACMRCRAVLYCNSTPGDVGNGQAQVATSGLLPGVAKTALGGAQLGEGIAGVAVTSTLGAVTAGIGLLLAPILAAFQHHAAAVAAQANALEHLCPYVSESIYKADQAVISGQVAPSDAIAFIQQIVQSFKSQTASLRKECNAFCGYDAIMDCIVQVSSDYYSMVTVNIQPQGDPTYIPPGTGPSPAEPTQNPSMPIQSQLPSFLPKLTNTQWLLVAGAGVALILLMGRSSTVVVQS